TAAQRHQSRAGDQSHHVAQIHRIALLDLLAGKEVAKSARAAIVEVAQYLATPCQFLDRHALDLHRGRFEHHGQREGLPFRHVSIERLWREAKTPEVEGAFSDGNTSESKHAEAVRVDGPL